MPQPKDQVAKSLPSARCARGGDCAIETEGVGMKVFLATLQGISQAVLRVGVRLLW